MAHAARVSLLSTGLLPCGRMSLPLPAPCALSVAASARAPRYVQDLLKVTFQAWLSQGRLCPAAAVAPLPS